MYDPLKKLFKSYMSLKSKLSALPKTLSREWEDSHRLGKNIGERISNKGITKTSLRIRKQIM
jgi:ribosomal protein L18